MTNEERISVMVELICKLLCRVIDLEERVERHESQMVKRYEQ